MAIVLDGSGLTIEKLVAIARHNEKVELSGDAVERIKKCRAMLERKIAAKEIMYGVNTGIGEFSEVVLARSRQQRHPVGNHPDPGGHAQQGRDAIRLPERLGWGVW